uniref:Serine/threonine-protein kinase EDR1-like n=1 Tax=Rhizophora mucronata TaxID=61149 RepID=A0A2P2PJ26_RHIMU
MLFYPQGVDSINREYSQSTKRESISSQLGRSCTSAQQSAINCPSGPPGISSRDPSLATA